MRLQLANYFVGEELHPAVGLINDESLVGAEELVQSHQRTDCVIAGSAAGVPNEVRIAFRQSSKFRRIEPAPIEQAVNTLRLASQASELFLQQSAEEQCRLLQVAVEQASWQNGVLQTKLFEPFEILRYSNRESHRKENENGGSGRDSEIWLPRMRFCNFFSQRSLMLLGGPAWMRTPRYPLDHPPHLPRLDRQGAQRNAGHHRLPLDRSLAPPATTAGTGLAGGTCTPYATPPGTTTDFDQRIDLDDTKLNGGAPGASVTAGGIASIDPNKLVRDPAAGCAPVYPWNFVRVNTIFGVVHAAGGYTAWVDKHASYSMVAGPGGTGLDDYCSPEVDSAVVPLPGTKTSLGAACDPIRDKAGAGSWTGTGSGVSLNVTGLEATRRS
jgi:hypothetical protein